MMAENVEREKQDAYFKSNIAHLVERARRKNVPVFSDFLDERQEKLARQILNHEKWDNFLFYGGGTGCERVLLGVFPEGMPAREAQFPITVLRVENTARALLSHRDYLGSLMGLQIKRECVGDIAVQDEKAYLFLSSKVAPFVEMELQSVGRYTVQSTEEPLGSVTVTQKFETLNGTVSSLRLDCMVSFLCNTSRKEAETFLSSHLVKVNGEEWTNGAKQVPAGSTISIRGRGRFILSDEMKQTKKDRLFITVQKLV